MNKIHPKDFKPMFNAMQGGKNYSFFFSDVKPYCVIRRVKDGKLFKTSNLTPEWIERVKQQLGDDECDVIASQDKDVGIGKLKIRRLMLHDVNNSSMTLEHPQSLQAAGINNVKIANLKDCTQLRTKDDNPQFVAKNNTRRNVLLKQMKFNEQ